MQSFLMAEEEFDKITLETANAIKTQFAILQFGITLIIYLLFIYY